MESNLWLNFNEKLLDESFNKNDFIIKTLQQINKDLLQVTDLQILPNEIEESHFKENLSSQLENILKKLDQTMPAQISQLLYLIDIPEQIISIIQQESGTYYNNLANIIIRREAYKVYLRSKF